MQLLSLSVVSPIVARAVAVATAEDSLAKDQRDASGLLLGACPMLLNSMGLTSRSAAGVSKSTAGAAICLTCYPVACRPS